MMANYKSDVLIELDDSEHVIKYEDGVPKLFKLSKSSRFSYSVKNMPDWAVRELSLISPVVIGAFWLISKIPVINWIIPLGLIASVISAKLSPDQYVRTLTVDEDNVLSNPIIGPRAFRLKENDNLFAVLSLIISIAENVDSSTEKSRALQGVVSALESLSGNERENFSKFTTIARQLERNSSSSWIVSDESKKAWDEVLKICRTKELYIHRFTGES